MTFVAPRFHTAAQLPQTDPRVAYLGAREGPFHCGGCRYFVDPDGCRKVHGTIDPDGCCNLYEKGTRLADASPLVLHVPTDLQRRLHEMARRRNATPGTLVRRAVSQLLAQGL